MERSREALRRKIVINTTIISKRLHGVALTVTILGMMAVSAEAASISYTGSGVFNGGGMSVAVSSTCINFYNGASPDTCPGTDTFTVGAPVDPSLPFALGAVGDIKDITTSPITDFETIGSVHFDLTGIIMPTAVTCPPVGAPATCAAGDFVFTQDDFSSGGGLGNVTVSFAVGADAYTGSVAAGYTPYHFLFSSQFTDSSITNILAQYISGTPVDDSVSFTASP